MRKTIRKVTMVVAVLMTSCQALLNRNSGPVISQATTMRTDRTKAHGLPRRSAERAAKILKRSPTVAPLRTVAVMDPQGKHPAVVRGMAEPPAPPGTWRHIAPD